MMTYGEATSAAITGAYQAAAELRELREIAGLTMRDLARRIHEWKQPVEIDSDQPQSRPFAGHNVESLRVMLTRVESGGLRMTPLMANAVVCVLNDELSLAHGESSELEIRSHGNLLGDQIKSSAIKLNLLAQARKEASRRPELFPAVVNQLHEVVCWVDELRSQDSPIVERAELIIEQYAALADSARRIDEAFSKQVKSELQLFENSLDISRSSLFEAKR